MDDATQSDESGAAATVLLLSTADTDLLAARTTLTDPEVAHVPIAKLGPCCSARGWDCSRPRSRPT